MLYLCLNLGHYLVRLRQVLAERVMMGTPGWKSSVPDASGLHTGQRVECALLSRVGLSKGSRRQD